MMLGHFQQSVFSPSNDLNFLICKIIDVIVLGC